MFSFGKSKKDLAEEEPKKKAAVTDDTARHYSLAAYEKAPINERIAVRVLTVQNAGKRADWYVKVTIGTESRKTKPKNRSGGRRGTEDVVFNEMLKEFGRGKGGLGTATSIFVQVKIDGTFQNTTKYVASLPITALTNNVERKRWLDLTTVDGASTNARLSLAMKLTGAQLVDEAALDPGTPQGNKRHSIFDLPTSLPPDMIAGEVAGAGGSGSGSPQHRDSGSGAGAFEFDASTPGGVEHHDDDDTAAGGEHKTGETDAEREARVKAEKAEAARQKKIHDYVAKRGEYQVQVHIIEVRGLKPEDAEGTSDPIVYASVFGQKQHTKVRKSVTNAVFDDTFFFASPRDADKDFLQMQSINIAVYDADTFSRNDMIGSVQCDLLDVYFREDHEMYRQWGALVDIESKTDSGIQGYIRFSITVLGPGDRPKKHDLAAELAEEDRLAAKADSSGGGGGGGIMGMVIMPPSIKQRCEYLVVRVHQVEGLPVMDKASLMNTKGSTDAYVTVEFAGNKGATHKVSAKGEGAGKVKRVSSVINEEVWMPVFVPSSQKAITVSVWDRDDMGADDRIGSLFIDFDECDKVTAANPVAGRLGPDWFNLYGAADDAHTSGIPGHQDKLKKEIEAMNRYPHRASTWRGRVLLTLKHEPDEARQHREVVHRRKLPMMRIVPKSREYVIWAQVYAGHDLPSFGSISTSSKLAVRVTCGAWHAQTAWMKPSGGVAEWNTKLTGKFAVPAEATQCADIFVYLVRKADSRSGDGQPVCYYRYDMANVETHKKLRLEKHGLGGPAGRTGLNWLMLHEDDSLNKLKDDEFPGQVLVRVALEPVDGHEAEIARQEPLWRLELDEAKRTQQRTMRVHLYQCRDLPAADSNGSLDPYLCVKAAGQAKKTPYRSMTTTPLFYSTYDCTGTLPMLPELLPPVKVEVFDHDVIGSDDFVGACHVPPADFYTADYSGAAVKLQDPKWYPLMFQRPDDTTGAVLLGVEILDKENFGGGTIPPPTSIVPAFSDAYVEVIAIGVRRLLPYALVPIQFPNLEVDLGVRNRKDKVFKTKKSKSPSGPNANFLQRMMIPVKLPKKHLFCPTLQIRVYDHRIGGLHRPLVGTTSIPLETKVPGSPLYVPPMSQTYTADGEDDENGAEDVDPVARCQALGILDIVTDDLDLDDERSKTGTTKKKKKDGKAVKFAATEGKTSSSGGKRKRRLELDPDGAPIDTKTGRQLRPSEYKLLLKAKRQLEQQKRRQAKNGGGKVRFDTDATNKGGGGGGGGGGGHPRSATEDISRLDAQLDAAMFAQEEEEGGGIAPPSVAGTPPISLATEVVAEAIVESKETGTLAGGNVHVARKTSNFPDLRIAGEDEEDEDDDVSIDSSSSDSSSDDDHEETRKLVGHTELYRQDGDGDGDGVVSDPYDETPVYLRGRQALEGSLEEFLKTTPFETYPIFRGQKQLASKTSTANKLDQRYRQVGTFKGVVRVVFSASAPPLFDLDALLTPRQHRVRLYVLNGTNIMALDDGGYSDPYLKVSLGGKTYNESDNYIKDTVEPDFYKMFEFNASLPGASVLEIECIDHDDFGTDDLVGRTTIDLEDRWFDQRWQVLGLDKATDKRYQPKPLERRALMNPSSANAQGFLLCWVDILTSVESHKYTPVDISLPAPEMFEVRVVIWKTKDVKPMDVITSMNDLYVKCWLEGHEPQNTDTHWRCKDGRGSFNWRCKFEVELPLKIKTYLSFQMWDKDILKYNDCIAETQIDLRRAFVRARKTGKAFQLFGGRSKANMTAAEKALTKANKKGKSLKQRRKSRHKSLGSSGSGGGGKAKKLSPRQSKENKKSGATSKGATTNPLRLGGPISRLDTDEAPDAALLGGRSSSSSSSSEVAININDPTAAAEAKKRKKKKKAAAAARAKASDADELVTSVREKLGFGKLPSSAEWLHMTRHDFETGEDEMMGSLAVSVEILPKKAAESRPAGFGRSAPNSHPYLPAPTGRLKLTAMWNPFYVATACLGPKIANRCIGFCCIAVGIAVAIVGGPFFGSIITIFNQATEVIPASLLHLLWMCLLICCACSCARCYCAQKRREREQAVAERERAEAEAKELQGGE